MWDMVMVHSNLNQVMGNRSIALAKSKSTVRLPFFSFASRMSWVRTPVCSKHPENPSDPALLDRGVDISIASQVKWMNMCCRVVKGAGVKEISFRNLMYCILIGCGWRLMMGIAKRRGWWFCFILKEQLCFYHWVCNDKLIKLPGSRRCPTWKSLKPAFYQLATRDQKQWLQKD